MDIQDKLKKYFDITGRAIQAVKIAPVVDEEKTKIILDMAERYYSDAKHFEEKNELLLAFGALNYAHGWLDCGAMLKFYEVKDDQLFTVDVK